MNNKVMELLNNQMEARNVLALEIVGEAKEALKALGLEELLNVGVTEVKTVVKEVKVPVEVIKEVEVVREVEKEVVVTKEVEVVREVSSKEDKETIAKLKKELERKSAPIVIEDNSDLIGELKLQIEGYKKTIAKLQNDLANQKKMYQSVINEMNKKITGENKSQAKIHTEESVDKEALKKLGLSPVKKLDTHIVGCYKGVPFEASKRVEATTIYDPKKWAIKDELNAVLVKAGLIQADRDNKDIHRVECEFGSCHEISPEKYMGYVVADNQSYSYVFDKSFANGAGVPTCISLKAYLVNPKSKFSPCSKKKIVAAIERLIAKHHDNVNSYKAKTSASVYETLGLTNDVVTNTVITNNATNADLFADITTVTTNSVITEPNTVADYTQENDDILDYGWN